MSIRIPTIILDYIFDALCTRDEDEFISLSGVKHRMSNNRELKEKKALEVRLCDMIAGYDTSLRDYFISKLSGKSDLRISRLMAELILYQGMDPVTICALNMIMHDSIDSGFPSIQLSAMDLSSFAEAGAMS